MEETQIPERQRQRLEALAALRMQRKTYEECSRELGVAVRTLQRWGTSPAYTQVWRELKAEWKESGEATVASMVKGVLSTMDELMRTARSEHVRFEAAKAIGDWARLGQEDTVAAEDDRAELARLQVIELQRQAALQQQAQVNVILPPGTTITTPDTPALPPVGQPVIEAEARTVSD